MKPSRGTPAPAGLVMFSGASASAGNRAGRRPAEALEVARRQRLRKIVTLGQLDARGTQRLGLECGLDTLGNDLHRCGLQQRPEPVQPWGLGLVGSQFCHELPVNFDEVEIAAREQCQVRPRERRVIERDPRAGGGNAVERIEAELVGMSRSVTSTMSCLMRARSPDLVAA